MLLVVVGPAGRDWGGRLIDLEYEVTLTGLNVCCGLQNIDYNNMIFNSNLLFDF